MGILDFFNAPKIKAENERLKVENANLQEKMSSLGVTEYYQTKEKIELLEKESDLKLSNLNNEISSNENLLAKLRNEVQELQEKSDALSKTVLSQERKISRCKELYTSLQVF